MSPTDLNNEQSRAEHLHRVDSDESTDGRHSPPRSTFPPERRFRWARGFVVAGNRAGTALLSEEVRGHPARRA